MDRVPSQPTESSRTENEDAPRGIYDVTTEFARCSGGEFARGVQDFLDKPGTQADFLDLLQIVSVDVWNESRASPVLRAAAALDKIQGRQLLRLENCQRTNSGTVISMSAMCGPDYKSVCIGGGGRVLVDSMGRAKVLQLYRDDSI